MAQCHDETIVLGLPSIHVHGGKTMAIATHSLTRKGAAASLEAVSDHQGSQNGSQREHLHGLSAATHKRYSTIKIQPAPVSGL